MSHPDCALCPRVQRLELYRSRLRRQLLLDIVNVHPLHGPELGEIGEYYGYDLTCGSVAVFVLKLSPRRKSSPERERQKAMHLARELLGRALDGAFEEYELCSTQDFVVGLLALSSPGEDWKEGLDRSFRSLRQEDGLLAYYLILGLGPAARDEESICGGFRAAVNALELGVMFGYDRVYDSSALDEVIPLDSAILSPLHQALLQDLLTARDKERLRVWIENLFQELAPVFQLHPVQAFRLPRELLQRADTIVRGLPGAEIFRQGQLLDYCVTLPQEQETLIDMFRRFCDAAPGALSPPVAAVQGHIALHYKEALSLKDLSDLCGLNPQYLSTLYRRETGRTITGHIMHLRILAAQALLRGSPLPVEQIANRVGYEDARYFSRIFQKSTGKTPSQYRKENQ